MSTAESCATEQQWRANTYRLLARLLAAPPDRDVLARLSAIEAQHADSPEPPLARAWKKLGGAARAADPESLNEEYHALFIGVAQGELMPFASWYLTGFLMEQPLALLRDDLAAIGIARRSSVREPEDHVAALCETMSVLIGDDDERQRAFFDDHLSSWMTRFFSDLEQAESARFYRCVGALGDAFVQLEQQWYDQAPAVG